MRILIAAHGFPPTHSAGAERRAERMARWLATHGHKVEVFAVEKLDEPGFRVETTTQDGFTVHRLHYDIKIGDFFHNLYDYPPAGEALREVLAQGQFDLVHVVSGYLLGGQAIHTVRDAGLPVVVTLTEYWFMCARLNLIQATGALCSGPESDEKCMRCLQEDKRRFRLAAQAAPAVMDVFWSFADRLPFAIQQTAQIHDRQQTLRQALDAATLVICPSHYLIQKFGEFGFDTGRFTFLRQGLAAPAGEKPVAERHDHILKLGYTGQIKRHKGVDLLVDAVIPLLDSGQSVSLDLWGSETEEPDYVAKLKAQTARYPAIRWNGRYVGDKVWDILAGMDVMVAPSRWYENSPNVILEAFAMNVPMIVTDLGGMAELVEHGTSGLVFELNNADDLRRQIERLLHEPGLLAQLKEGIPPVKTIDQEMEELVAHYERLIQG
ncbi:MAG: glycosyltransferase [Anaerolineaceae bacterium]|nr:glycosyltransferase [Anaerolineaceae bacterium]